MGKEREGRKEGRGDGRRETDSIQTETECSIQEESIHPFLLSSDADWTCNSVPDHSPQSPLQSSGFHSPSVSTQRLHFPLRQASVPQESSSTEGAKLCTGGDKGQESRGHTQRQAREFFGASGGKKRLLLRTLRLCPPTASPQLACQSLIPFTTFLKCKECITFVCPYPGASCSVSAPNSPPCLQTDG